jgi:glycosyltransferase involved in cell wall biosynthesis
VPVIWHQRNLLWQNDIDVARQFLGWSDGVICNSAAVAERFRVNGAISAKVRVILNGVDPAYFVPAPNKAVAKERLGWSGRKVVGTVTNLEPRKGVEVFLELAASIVRQRKDVLFAVIGGCYGSDDRRMDSLKAKASALGLAEHLVWVGFQSDVRPYAGAFDMTVHVTAKEACSRAILESMSMRIPVVAFNDGGNPELIVDGVSGALVPSGRCDILLEKVVSLLDRDVELSRMGQAARQRVQDLFDVRRNASETQAFYGELLKGKI